MSQFYPSNPTAKRLPHPLGRRIKIGALLSGLDGDAIVDDYNAGVLGTTVTTGGVWANLDATSITTLGQIANMDLMDVVENAVILTEHAPITKGYGDAQLAGVDDVTIKIDGVAATIVAMEPALGLLVLDQTVVPDADVKVSYHYTPNPTLEFQGLNNMAYRLNQSGDKNQAPFTYDAVLGPYNRPQPKQYEHRYQAFDYEYTAVLNDPTSLVLNEPKHRLTLPKFSRQKQATSLFFEGDGHPVGMEHVGPSLGSPVIENGLYVVEDLSTSTNVVDSQPSYFRKEVDLSFEHVSILNFRMEIEDYTKDGDFTGVAAGYAGESKLQFIGFLDIDGFKAVGLLKDPWDESRWQSYAGLGAEVTNDLDWLSFDSQPPLSVGQRIFFDSQVYDVLDIDEDTTSGEWLVQLDRDAHVTGEISLFPEIDWSSLKTYRAFKGEGGQINVLVGGNILPVATLEEEEAAVPTEIFELVENNSMFFGSLSRKASNKSLWDFARYSLMPVTDVEESSRVTVTSEFDQLPEDEEEPWYLSDNQGYATLVGPSLLTQSAGQRYVGGSLNYTRIEPFLTSKATLDLTTSVRVQSYATGSPAYLTASDQKKELTIALFDNVSALSYKNVDALSRVTQGFWNRANANSLQSRGHVNGLNETPLDQFLEAFGGAESFADVGWTSTLNAAELSFYDHYMSISHDGGTYESVAESTGKGTFSDEVLGIRLRFGDYTLLGSGQVPVYFGVSDGNDQIYLTPYDDGANKHFVFCDEDGALFTDGGGQYVGFQYDWDDGDFHHLRWTRYGQNVTVFMNGQYQAVFDVADLPDSAVTDVSTKFGLLDGTVDVDVDYFFAHSAPHDTRKIGIYKGGGDLLDASNYELVNAEWFGTYADLRIRRNPVGRVEIFLNGQSTPILQMQYTDLPDRVEHYNTNTDLGYVQFGTMDPQAYSEVMWEHINYDIINQRDNQKANNQSYLNRYNVISSPESVIDEGPESVSLTSTTATTVRLAPSGMHARQVLSVVSEDGSTTYPFTYDPESNTVEIMGAGLPSEQENVTVTFWHSKPYTKAYLKNNRAYTTLNEGTPPMPLSQQVQIEVEATAPGNSTILDPDFVMDDGSTVVKFKRNDEAFYENLNLMTSTDDGEVGLIAPACDEDGFIELTFEGPFDEETVELPPQEHEPTRHRHRIGYFNQSSSTLNDIQTNTVGIESPISVGISQQLEEDTYGGVSDSPQSSGSVLRDNYGTATFNNPKTTLNKVVTDTSDYHDDSVIARANTVVYVEYTLDFLTAVNP
jgi:hypothetical protein